MMNQGPNLLEKEQLEEALDAESLTEINKQIFEIKKKIQLSEGQRKALFESCDAERKANADTILRLKREIVEFTSELKCAGGTVDVKQLTYKLSESLPPIVANKRYEKVYEMIDLQVIDSKKKLDVLKYQAKQKENKLKKIIEKNALLTLKRAANQTPSILPVDHPLIQKKVELENEIHRINLQTTEASHIKRKYAGIKYHLLSDSVRFENTLKTLEDEIKVQQKEIVRLQEINNEASELRNQILTILENEQKAALDVSKRHEMELMESQRKVEQRSQELRKLERRIVQDAMKSGPVVNKGSEVNSDEEEENEVINENNTEMEEACEKLKQATGAMSISEVLKHFQVQRETFISLKGLRTKTEKEKEEVEKIKQKMMCELELYKFSSDKDNDEAVSKINEMETEIVAEEERLADLEHSIQIRTDALIAIATALHNLCITLRYVQEQTDTNDNVPKIGDYENEPPGKPEFMEELLKMLNQRLHILLDDSGTTGRDSGLDVLDTETPIVEENQFPEQPIAKHVGDDDVGLYPPSYTTLAAKSPASVMIKHIAPTSQATTEDEDDVPTRGYLKRQAQLIVDAKSRRKTFKLMIPQRK